MLLSFSVEAMRPMIVAGLRQYNGSETSDGGVRVKRQTIRRRGPRAEALLAAARERHWHCPYDLHLWWKSRTKERALLGVVNGAYVMPVRILHAPPLRDVFVTLADDDLDPAAIARFADADGFDGVAAFRDYFVPRPGDVFDGVIFSW